MAGNSGMQSLAGAIGKANAGEGGETKGKKKKGKGKKGQNASKKVWVQVGTLEHLIKISISQVEPDTPLQKAQALVNRILKEANNCRLLGSNYFAYFYLPIKHFAYTTD